MSINETHLVITNEFDKWSFENHQPTSPLYLLLVLAGAGLLLYFLFRGSDYNIDMLHPLARVMLASKVIGMMIVMLCTALFTLEMVYALVMGLVLLAVGLFVSTFALLSSASKSDSFRRLDLSLQWVLVLIALFIVELFLFGSSDLQFVSCIALLVLQMWRKYHIPKIKNSSA